MFIRINHNNKTLSFFPFYQCKLITTALIWHSVLHMHYLITCAFELLYASTCASWCTAFMAILLFFNLIIFGKPLLDVDLFQQALPNKSTVYLQATHKQPMNRTSVIPMSYIFLFIRSNQVIKVSANLFVHKDRNTT